MRRVVAALLVLLALGPVAGQAAPVAVKFQQAPSVSDALQQRIHALNERIVLLLEAEPVGPTALQRAAFLTLQPFLGSFAAGYLLAQGNAGLVAGTSRFSDLVREGGLARAIDTLWPGYGAAVENVLVRAEFSEGWTEFWRSLGYSDVCNVEVTAGGYIPGTLTPGMYTPGRVTPGIQSPGVYINGIYMPGAYTPGTYIPGIYIPGFYTAGTYAPKQVETVCVWVHQQAG